MAQISRVGVPLMKLRQMIVRNSPTTNHSIAKVRPDILGMAGENKCIFRAKILCS